MASKTRRSCIRYNSRERKSANMLILGDCKIGKTTLIQTYLGGVNTPPVGLDPFKRYRLQMKYYENVIDICLIDLDPGSTSPERRDSYPTDVDAILLCFSAGHFRTLKSVYNLWIHEVRAHFGKLVPVFLVGLQSDLRLRGLGHSPFPVEDRVTEKCEAEIIHKNYYFHGDYMECSMYDVKSVVEAIQRAFSVTIED